MIEGKAVTKKYGETIVLDGVSLNIEKGKITSIIGPNGAGKSTLLGIVSRLVSPNEGDILVEGTGIKSWNPTDLAKKLSILKQSNTLNLRMTVRELVSFGRFPYSQGRLTDEDWRHVDNAMAHMDLSEIQDKLLDHLSGGQRQRAFIAMVVAQNTDYILLDEPLNSLDMKHSVEMMKTLQSLAHNLGKAIVLVLHDINFASCYSDIIIALRDGRLVRQGTVEEIIQEDAIKEIFDMPMRIEEIDGQRICIYF